MFKSIFLSITILIALAVPALGQNCCDSDFDDGIAGCFGCAVMIFGIFVALILLALSIWATVWVSKDAKARGLESASLFTILMIVGILFRFWWIVWIVYLLTRPKDKQIASEREISDD